MTNPHSHHTVPIQTLKSAQLHTQPTDVLNNTHYTNHINHVISTNYVL